MSQSPATPEATAEAEVNLEAGLGGRNDDTGAVQTHAFFLLLNAQRN
jgi:hypothetical protein